MSSALWHCLFCISTPHEGWERACGEQGIPAGPHGPHLMCREVFVFFVLPSPRVIDDMAASKGFIQASCPICSVFLFLSYGVDERLTQRAETLHWWDCRGAGRHK